MRIGGDPPDHRRELQLLLKSGVSIVYLDTIEEGRAEQLVRDVARSCNRPFYSWSVTQGLRGAEERAVDEQTLQAAEALRMIERTADHGVYLMRNLAAHLQGDLVLERLMLDIAHRDTGTLVLVGQHGPLPEVLRPHSALLALPRPDLALIDTQIRSQLQQLRGRGRDVSELDDQQLAQLSRAMSGLTLEEVDQVLTRLIEQDGRLTVDDIAEAVAQKGRLLARSGIVELVTPTHGLDWVAGFEELKRWAAVRAAAFAPAAEAYGLPAPRGVLLTGVPGCGKSYVVKAIAHDWQMPLLRLDAGALFDKFIGSSEKNLRQALQTAEALSPSILWIDEIEKGFASTSPSESDGGLAYRMVGMLATWMQERTKPVFVAATSNDITLLPPELTRQGRFDEVFFVDLPDELERQHLFTIQLARRGRDWQTFDTQALSSASAGFSGSEIEQSVVNSLYSAFAAGRDITTQDVLAELRATRPLAQVSPEKVAAIRRWGVQHARAVT